MLRKAAQTAVSGICRAAARASAAPRLARRVCAAVLLLLAVAASGHGAGAQPVTAELSVDTTGGFARIVYRFSGDVDATARQVLRQIGEVLAGGGNVRVIVLVSEKQHGRRAVPRSRGRCGACRPPT